MSNKPKEFITTNAKQTQKLGEILAEEILQTKKSKVSSAWIFCLKGELGAGKTTFTQGFLKGLKIKGPYTSPTFVIMKHYHKKFPNKFKISDIYHIDTYRVKARDILDLGWEEIISNPQNIIIVEWADKIKKIIPNEAIWLNFSWLGENERKIKISLKNKRMKKKDIP